MALNTMDKILNSLKHSGKSMFLTLMHLDFCTDFKILG